MSFMDAIKNLKTKISNKAKMREYQGILNQLVDGAEMVYSTATKSALPCLYIYVTKGANIDTVKGIYADMGIKLEKHISHLDGKKREVLFISTPDLMKLSEEQQKFLTKPTEKGYKRTVELSVRRSR